MTTTRILRLISDRVKINAQHAIDSLPVSDPPAWEVVLRPAKTTRNLEQNAKMWAMLSDISAQVVWFGQKLAPHEWKDAITAELKKQRMVPGISGGFVVLGERTSKMSIKEMSDVIEMCHAFGAEQGVKWSSPERGEK